MTIEELEIIIEANIEPAIKEIKKLMPQIKANVEQAVNVAQKSMEQIDMRKMTSKVQKAIQDVKNKISKLKKSNTDNEVTIKINNEEAKKQITQLEKEISSLQKKISARQMKLDLINPQMDKIISDTRNEVVPKGVSKNDPSMDKVVDSALSKNANFKSLSNQSQKLYTDIELYNKQVDIAKSKLSQLKQEVSNTSVSQNKLTSFFNAFNVKIKQAKSNFNQLPKITQKVTNNIKNMGSGLKSSLKHVIRYAMALFSLRGIYSVLSNSASSWLSSQNEGAQQLSANIEYMKYTMGSAFAPVIEMIINLVYKLMKAIQSLVYAFSGINIFAKATASSMGKAAGSVSKANKSLSGIHGEINNVSENNENGNGSISPNIDLSSMDNSINNWANSIKNKITTVFAPYLNSIENTIDNIKTSFSTAWETNGGETIVLNLSNAFSNLWSIIESIQFTFEEWTSSESFQTFANSIIGICTTLSSWFEKITSKLKEIWENGGKETFEKLLTFLSKLTEAIDVVLKALEPVIQWILDTVTPVITGIVQAIGFVIDALSGVLDFIIGVFTGDWNRAWQGVKDFFEGIWNTLKTIVDIVINFVKDIIDTVLTKIKEIWEKIWNGIKTFFSNLWESIKTIVINVIDKIKEVISNILTKIKEIWEKIWNGIKTVVTNVWNGIWNTIKNVINSILGGIENFVNGTIRGINKILSGISSVANAVGSLIGLDPINLQLSEISLPRLAKGNVAYSETMAIFGEYSGASHNPEITTPQNIMRETFADVLSDYGATSGNGQPIRVQIYWGTKTVVDEIIDGINEKTRQTGKAQIKVSYA